MSPPRAVPARGNLASALRRGEQKNVRFRPFSSSSRICEDAPVPRGGTLARPDEATLERLRREAVLARERSYAPYSKFLVGAAVLSRSGKVYRGQNVENASYGLGVCAERTAIFAMVAAGEVAIDAIAVATQAKKIVGPCGACRQVIREFGPDAIVTLVTTSGQKETLSLRELLPRDFGPGDLGFPEPSR
ncbi:cytidine deaminase [bacterium]|nr:cytidine deaminase [bacterium]